MLPSLVSPLDARRWFGSAAVSMRAASLPKDSYSRDISAFIVSWRNLSSCHDHEIYSIFGGQSLERRIREVLEAATNPASFSSSAAGSGIRGVAFLPGAAAFPPAEPVFRVARGEPRGDGPPAPANPRCLAPAPPVDADRAHRLAEGHPYARVRCEYEKRGTFAAGDAVFRYGREIGLGNRDAPTSNVAPLGGRARLPGVDA